MVGGEERGLGVGDVLDAVERWHTEQLDREMRIFVAAAHVADLHHPGSRGADEKVLAGMERGVRPGGVGTPTVLEFAAAELGPRIGRSPYAARMLMADALDVRHRLPRLWARVCAGEVPVRFARHVAQQTRELSQPGAGLVDCAVAEYADGRLTWSRFEALVAAKVIEADPDAAAERERAAAQDEFAKVGRSNDHGQKTLYVRSSAAAVTRMDATIAFLADALAALGDTDTEHRRRAKAMLVLANPVQALQLLQAFAAHRSGSGRHEGDTGDQDTLDVESGEAVGDAASASAQTSGCGDLSTAPAQPPAAFTKPFRPYQVGPDSRFGLGFDPRSLLPQVTLYLHLYARTDTGEVAPVARWEGEGPITSTYLRDTLGPACRFTVKPVIDLEGMAPVDAYEIPDRHREAVHLRTPADVFPFASSTARAHQVDHTSPYVPPDHGGPPGQTALGNLGPMTTFHHRVKTHGHWQVKQPFPGIYLWRDPHGHCYLVDHTGTRPLGRTGPGRGLEDTAIDIVPATGPGCYYQHHHAA
jgi:hypothetical protein